MTLNIKNEEADRLARRLAETTGESLTRAVTTALQERLARIEGRSRLPVLRQEIARIQDRVAALPCLDDRSDDELHGYDEHGLPR